MTLRLLERLNDHARVRPDSIAILPVSNPKNSLTYAQLRDAVNRFAATLSSRFSPGDVVMLACSNVPEFHVAFLAALAADLVVFPVPPELVEAERVSAVDRSRAKSIVTIDEIRALLTPSPRTRGEGWGEGPPESLTKSEKPPLPNPLPEYGVRQQSNAALYLQSSGTTGRSKIVLRDGKSLDAVSENMANAIGFTETDRVLATVPLCHSYGLEHGLLAPIWAGSTIHLCDGFDLPLILRELSENNITIFPAVPFLFEAIAATIAPDKKFPSLRTVYSAGGPLPATIFENLENRHGLRVAQLYGATEIGSVTFNDPNRKTFDSASVGQPFNDVSIRILDNGEVAIKATSMFARYIDSDEPAPLLDGYFLTGDLGKISADGSLTLIGRLKFLIDVGGRKVNPMEVEDVLRQHPAVDLAVVVPLQMSETIFRLKAIVTLRESQKISPDELRAFARQHLSAYKVPRVVEFRDSLPRSSTGKILRNKIEA